MADRAPLRLAVFALLWAALAQAASAGWLSKSEKEITAEADGFVKNKPDALQPFFHTLYMEGEWNAVLNFDLLALAALEVNRADIAEKALDQATKRIGATFSDDPQGHAARAQWAAQDVRDFRGEPYERAMAFYYRGLLYLRADDLAAARTAFVQAAQQNALGQAEEYPSTFALPLYLAAWTASCLGDAPGADALLASAQKFAPDPFVRQAAAPLPRHITIFERGMGPRKVTTAESRSNLRFLPRPDVKGAVVEIRYAKRPHDAPLRGVAANLDWLAMTRGGRQVVGIADGRAQYPDGPGPAKAPGAKDAATPAAEVPDPEAAAAFYGSLSTLGGDNVSIARRLGMAASRSSLLGATSAGAPRPGRTDADTRYWGSLPKLVYVEAYAEEVGLEAGDISTPATAVARPALLQGRHEDKCSFAFGREFSALDATQGGIGNPSPWPAEPLEDNREKANEALRTGLRSAF
jgi:tetratricopeptide (TPR) repeat protein